MNFGSCVISCCLRSRLTGLPRPCSHVLCRAQSNLTVPAKRLEISPVEVRLPCQHHVLPQIFWLRARDLRILDLGRMPHHHHLYLLHVLV